MVYTKFNDYLLIFHKELNNYFAILFALDNLTRLYKSGEKKKNFRNQNYKFKMHLKKYLLFEVLIIFMKLADNNLLLLHKT